MNLERVRVGAKEVWKCKRGEIKFLLLEPTMCVLLTHESFFSKEYEDVLSWTEAIMMFTIAYSN